MTQDRRSDFQGLRAIAVLSVMLFHAGVAGIPGGFVGVDVFFVLSGFFITRILMRDIEQHGRIRFASFWASRARRLLPNGLLVILCVVAAAALLLPTYRLEGVSADAVSAAGFFANIHFAATAIDYFHLDDPPSPLLHYWSLAVEEQFYLVLPVLMALAALVFGRRRRTVAIMLCVIAFASLAAALVVIGENQPAAFFHPQYRAWQLALGGLVGLAFDARHRIPARARQAGVVLGGAAVAASILLLSEQMPYPGYRALFPTLGTAALLIGLDAGGLATPLSRLLGLPSMVRVGDWSYSLYLWHWPVIVFIAAFWPAPGPHTVAAALILTFATAVPAWYFVERPIHRRAFSGLHTAALLMAAAVSVVAVVAVSMGLRALPGNTDPQIAARIAEAARDLGPNYVNGCHRDFADTDQPECRFAGPGPRRVVLFGDSHAAQWFTALVAAAEQEGWQAQIWTKTSCPTPAVTVWYAPSKSTYRECDDWREARLDALVASPPDLVLLGDSGHYHGWVLDPATGGPAARASAETLWQTGFETTAARLVEAGIRVVALRDTPSMYRGYKDCLSSGRWDACYRPRAEALAGLRPPAAIEQLDLSDDICAPDRCHAARGDDILFRDSAHLTANFAKTLAPRFAPLLREAGSR